MRVLVTGATGFVGRTLCQALQQAGHNVRAAVRRVEHAAPEGAEQVVTGELAAADWSEALRDVQCVIHTAARAHVSNARSDPELYVQTNARATQRLAAASLRAGVDRFVYLSSIKVNGEGAGRPYTEHDEPQPQDAYGRSKWLGEKYAVEAASGSSMGVVIVRPPLVYGPGVKANFLRLMHWVDQGWPLPLASVDNRRSLVNVWNLCDLLQRLLVHSDAPGRIWMVCDGEDLSTPELVRRIARAMNRPVRLFPMPPAALRYLGSMVGRGLEVARLFESLTVDATTTRNLLGWVAPVTINDGIARTVHWYRSQVRGRAA